MDDGIAGRVLGKSKQWVEAQREQLARERAAMLRKLQERDAHAAAAAFDAIDVSGRGALTREEARRLLQTVMGTDDDILEDGLDMVFLPASAAAHDANAETAPELEVGISISIVPQATRDELIKGVSKYRTFLKRFGEIDEIFKLHDRDRNEGLDRTELRQVILWSERLLAAKNARRRLEKPQPEADKRKVGTRELQLEPSEADLDGIMFACDVNRDGYINRAETVAALAEWARLATQLIAERNEASRRQGCCAVA